MKLEALIELAKGEIDRQRDINAHGYWSNMYDSNSIILWQMANCTVWIHFRHRNNYCLFSAIICIV